MPSPAKIRPREKPREVGEARAVLGVEQPLVGAERAVEPQRVVEARRHDVFREHAAAVRNQSRVEQHHVGGVSQHALMDRRLVGQPAGGADPDIEAAVLRLFAEIAAELHGAEFDRPLALVIAPRRFGQQRIDAVLELLVAGQFVRPRHVGHLDLMVQARLGGVE